MEVMNSLETAIQEVRIIGGGATSALWRQIIADILGVEVFKMERDDSSLGSAMLAGVGTGLFSSFLQAVEKCTRVVSLIKPDPKRNRQYTRQFAIYKEIQQALVEVNHKIAESSSRSKDE
jgi:xylulokinase